ncbi:TPA: hypothetical protein ACSVPQ_003624 [Clostridioides difficile]|nr:hypothetical protein [Clostridioides difficile]MDI2978161.1 hypothetical protein [Clostridioides difficile]MDI6151104.1 hypothetical protein [Clostridioides difficile]MDI7827555.1 hypothetical protein [Clostridioides difficile]
MNDISIDEMYRDIVSRGRKRYLYRNVKTRLVYIGTNSVKWNELNLPIEDVEKLCINAVKQNGEALKYSKVQTKEICLLAVKRYGLAIRDIKWDELDFSNEEIYEIYLIAVSNTGFALESLRTEPSSIY